MKGRWIANKVSKTEGLFRDGKDGRVFSPLVGSMGIWQYIYTCMIYNYIFYKSHKLYRKSGNFEGSPVFAGILPLLMIIPLNLYTAIFLIEIILKKDVGFYNYGSVFKYSFAILFYILITWYYKHNKRWKKVVEKYEHREQNSKLKIPSIVVLLISFVISFVLLMLTGMYKNGDGVFAG